MPRTRSYDSAAMADAAAAQWRVLADAAASLSPAESAARTGLGDWDVAALLAHVTAGIRAVHRTLAVPGPGPGPGPAGPSAPPVSSLVEYLSATSTVADAVAARGRSLAAGRSITSLAAGLGTEAESAVAALDDRLARNPGQLVVARLGSLSLADWVVTRLVEAVVHTLDLGRALGRPVHIEPAALGPVTRALADVLVSRAPGPAVEVRIPPYAAVQCLPGPRHTRGTPANVVEFASPAAWLLVATGRTPWSVAVATGEVRASGERADLSAYLPVMR